MSSLFDPSRNQEASGMGLIAHIDGKKSRRTITQSIAALGRMSHGSGDDTCDGCGILIPMPREFFLKQWPLLKRSSEKPWAVGQFFLPHNTQLRSQLLNIIKQSIDFCNLHFLDGREVFIAPHILNKVTRSSMPFMAQILVCPKDNKDLHISGNVFERQLFLTRCIIEHSVKTFLHTHGHDTRQFHVVSFSSQTIVYKALVTSAKLGEFYLDLQHDAFLASYAIFHQRFSNNRLPSWRAAQPMRMLAHSGEIPSLHGMISYLDLCIPMLQSSIFGKDLKKLLPVIRNKYSPAASLDNLCEFLFYCGRSIPQILMMLFPEHLAKSATKYLEQRAFHQFNAALLPPLSGASCMLFSDGYRFIGAMQGDKSLQPCRYSLSTDGLFMLETEAGALDMPTKNIKTKGRVHVGQLIALDLLEKRILYNEEIKGNIIQGQKYIHLVSDFLSTVHDTTIYDKNSKQLHSANDNYSQQTLLHSEQEHSKSLAIFRENTSFFDYFNLVIPPFIQNNAEINLESFVGRKQNFLEPHAEVCKTLYLIQPFIHVNELENLLKNSQKHICLHTIYAYFKPSTKLGLSLQNALNNMHHKAAQCLKDGATILRISHSPKSATKSIPIPALLAVSSLNKYLLKKQLRHLCGIIVDMEDTHKPLHMVQLLNAGADAICPRRACNEFKQDDAAYMQYVQDLHIGLKKILHLLNISALLSLKNGQYFEAIGIGEQVINEHFHNIVARMGGLNMEQIAIEAQNNKLHHAPNYTKLNIEQERYNNELKILLQQATQKNNMRIFRTYLNHCHGKTKPHSLHCLLKLKKLNKTLPSMEIAEPISDILKRFVLIAMPKLSAQARYCLMQGYHDAGCTATVTNNAGKLTNSYELHFKNLNLINELVCEEIQISLSSHMVDSHKAITLMQHDLASLNDIKQLIHDLRKAHPHARISIKIPSHLGIGQMGVGLVKAGAHCLLIYGCDDIPTSSPLFTMPAQAHPWEMGLAELQHALTANNLRRQVRLRVLGQFFTGKDILKATLLGAEEFAFPTPTLLSLGCNLCYKCSNMPCPKGLMKNTVQSSTYTPTKFLGNAQNISNFLTLLADDVRRELSLLGFAYMDQVVGRSNLLDLNHKEHKCSSLCLNPLMQASSGTLGQRSGTPSYAPLACTALESAIFEKMLSQSHKKNINYNYCGTINIADRSIGTHISGALMRHNSKYTHKKNVSAQVHNLNLKLWGSAGQSLGAFLSKGITLWVFGEANDHVGKGLSGGTIAISHAPDSPLVEGNHTIIGNVALYGASSGELYINGMAGEYFAVANNGACAVVEGVGDFACKHMQNGTVIVLGPCGKYFAENMLGGRAYVFDPTQHFIAEQSKKIKQVEDDDIRTLHFLLQQHIHFTKSKLANNIINDWNNTLEQFILIKA